MSSHSAMNSGRGNVACFSETSGPYFNLLTWPAKRGDRNWSGRRHEVTDSVLLQDSALQKSTNLQSKKRRRGRSPIGRDSCFVFLQGVSGSRRGVDGVRALLPMLRQLEHGKE